MDALKPRRLQLYLASFFLDAIGHAFPLLVSLHAKKAFGATSMEMGILGAVWMSLYSLMCFTAGGWSDRFGSLWLVRLSLVFLGAALLPALFLASRFWHLVAAMGAFGVALAFFWPPLQRQLSLYSPGRLLWPALGAFNVWWGAGSVMGTIEGGPTSYLKYGWGGVIAGMMGFVVLAFLSLTGLRGREGAAHPVVPVEPVDPGCALLFLRLGWAANFCASFAMGGLHVVFADVTAKLGLGDGWSTTVLVAKEAGRLSTFALLRLYSGWHYSFRWLACLQALGAAALICGGWVTSPAFLCGVFAVLGVYSGLSYYSSILYSLNLRADEGKRSGVHEGVLALGVVMGPLVLGAVGQLVPAWGGAAITATGGVILVGLGVEAAMVLAASTRAPRRVTSAP